MAHDSNTRDPLERLASDPVAPPEDPNAEPTDSNPVPLSPTDPRRRTSEGDSGVVQPGVVPIPLPGAPGGSGGTPQGSPVVAPIIESDVSPDDRDRS